MWWFVQNMKSSQTVLLECVMLSQPCKHWHVLVIGNQLKLDSSSLNLISSFCVWLCGHVEVSKDWLCWNIVEDIRDQMCARELNFQQWQFSVAGFGNRWLPKVTHSHATTSSLQSWPWPWTFFMSQQQLESTEPPMLEHTWSCPALPSSDHDISATELLLSWLPHGPAKVLSETSTMMKSQVIMWSVDSWDRIPKDPSTDWQAS